MANVLTPLIPHLYAGLNVVSRELVGYIPAVTRNGSLARAAVGDPIEYHTSQKANVSDIAPAMNVPEPTDQSLTAGTFKITKSRSAEFGFTGEEQLSINNGHGFPSVQAEMFGEGIRALTNEIEGDCAAAAYIAASRAYGTAGTTPFASGVGDSAQLRKVLDDNGAPPGDRQLIIATTGGANLRTNLQLTKANEAQDNTMLRQGTLLDMHGFAIGESGQAKTHTKGTGAGYLTNDATLAVGDTVIAADTGTGTILPGDVVTFAGDTNKYVVFVALGGGSFTIAAPGLLTAVGNNVAITVGASFEANVGFARSALHLASRAPAKPEEGDAAIDTFMLTDPRSGLTFEVCVYAGYKKMRYEVGMAWGVGASKPEHIGLLLG